MGSDTNIFTTQNHLPPSTMQHRGYIVFLGLISAISIDCSEKLDAANEKAASPLINCGCQCSSLTFRDANGVVQGNCLTVDSTGAQWCYVDQAYSSCQDLVPSKRFPNNPWSYEACATPAPGSPLCPVAPAAPAPIVTVPVAPTVTVPVAPTDIHVTAPHHHHDVPHHHDAVPAGVPSLNDVLSGGYDPESIGDIRQGDATSKINLPGSK